jgi:hypothetical protein
MKRLSQKCRWRQVLVQKNFAIATARRRRLKAWRQANTRMVRTTRNGRPARMRVLKVGTPLPNVFCLDKNFSEVAQALEVLRERICRTAVMSSAQQNPAIRRLPSWYDFSTISEMSPAAALILAAEFDRGRLLSGRPLYTIDRHTWHPQVSNLLNRLGVPALLGVAAVDETAPVLDGDEVITAFRSGDNVAGPTATQALQELAKLATWATSTIGNKEARVIKNAGLYSVLVEAIENTKLHAYPVDMATPHPNVGRWWIAGAAKRSSRTLTLVVYDQGVSIPQSLPSWQKYDSVSGLLLRVLGKPHNPSESSTDGIAMRVAMKVALTRTNQVQHGKGLRLMQSFIDSCEGGRLRVISRRGEFVYEKGLKPKATTHHVSIGGTLIEWSIKV